jgi:GGDEF domain-containing protein
VLLLCVAVLVHSSWLTLALPALHFLYYCGLIGGILLAWRFHSSRIFLALLVLFLADQAVGFYSSHAASVATGWTAFTATAALVPLNFVLIALLRERGFTISALAPFALLLFVQAVIVAVVGSSEAGSAVPVHAHRAIALSSLAVPTLAIFAAAGVFLLARCLLTQKPADSALLWSLTAFFLSLHFSASARLTAAYSATAVSILAISIIETSYLLAYHDELTTLPSRRAYNDALQRLQHPYCIAAVDIDHFKQFNDTYGHDTGDQVLRLVAAKLAEVGGGGQAYRCGGEEFSILFPGKSADEVTTDLEKLRVTIENTGFRMRGQERRQAPRGPDRRNLKTRGRDRKGDAIRKLVRDQGPAPLSVTVSIGLAGSTSEKALPDLVMEEADKALYRAKAKGRNRLELAARKRRDRTRAAGIA